VQLIQRHIESEDVDPLLADEPEQALLLVCLDQILDM
jgi:hypothetical protein